MEQYSGVFERLTKDEEESGYIYWKLQDAIHKPEDLEALDRDVRTIIQGVDPDDGVDITYDPTTAEWEYG